MGNTKWKYVPFCDAVDILDNLRRPINSKERQSRIEGKDKSELYPYYGATGQVGYIDDYLTDGEYVLLGEDGAPFLDPYAKKAYIISGKTWVNNHAHILRSKTDNKFLCYFLNSFNYKGFVSGTTRFKLTQQSMKQILVPVPPLDEQKRIVARIEELFSELDAAVATLERTKEQLAVYRQAVLKEAFDGEWTYQLITDVVSSDKHSIVIGPFGSDLKVSDYCESGVPLVFVKDIRDNFSDKPRKYVSVEKAEKLSAHKVSYGDLLITKMGDPPGDCAIYPNNVDAIITADCIKVTVNPEIINSKYLMYYIISSFGRKQVDDMTCGVAQKKMSLKRFKAFTLPKISLAEQENIISEIESRLSVCDKIEETVTTALQEAEAMRQSILKQAFAGEL